MIVVDGLALALLALLALLWGYGWAAGLLCGPVGLVRRWLDGRRRPAGRHRYAGGGRRG